MSKIYYDLNKSCYNFKTQNFLFFFSSNFYLERFKKKYLENRKIMRERMSSRYNIEINTIDYFDIILYESIEKRGFKIYNIKSEVEFTCLNQVILDGEIRMQRSSTE